MACTAPPRRLLLATCMATALIASACTTEPAEPTPTPTAAASTDAATPMSTPTFDPPSADGMASAAADLVVDAFDAIYNDRGAARTVVRDATAPQSQARQWLLERIDVAEAIETTAGDVLTEVQGAALEDDRVIASVCLSAAVESSSSVASGNGWASYTVVADQPDQPRLRRITIDGVNADGSGEPESCVPQAITDSFFESYEDWRDATLAFLAAPQDPAARSEVAQWVEGGDASLGNFRERSFAEGTWVEPVIEEAGRDTLVMSYCQDPDLNPDARIEHPDGRTEDLQPTATRVYFTNQDGTWLEQDFTNHGPDSGDPDPWNRCFGPDN